MDVKLDLRLSSELKAAAELAAKNRGETVSAAVRKFLEEYSVEMPSDAVLEEVCRNSRESAPKGNLITILDIFNEEDEAA